MSKNDLTKAEWNKLVEEMLERDKKLVGTVIIPGRGGKEYVPSAPLERTQTATMIAGYTLRSMGDPDPLYTDPEYGKYTRYASIIAPPTFLITFGLDVPRLNGPDFPGSNEFQGGTAYDYSANKVVKPGDEIYTVIKYLGYTDKTNHV